jgi:hypothetical protein
MFTNSISSPVWSFFPTLWSSMPTLWLGLLIFWIVCLWRVFEKAGQPGWAAIVPIYNLVVLLKVCRRPVSWILDLIVMPLVGVVAAIIALVIFAQRAASINDPATAALGGILSLGLYLGGCIYGFVYWVRLLISLGRVFGKDVGFIIGLIVPVISIVFWALLAFDGSQYRGERPVSRTLPPAPDVTASPSPMTPGKVISLAVAGMMTLIAILFFLPQCRIDAPAYQSTFAGLNLTLGTRPYVHVDGISDADYQKLIDAVTDAFQSAGQKLPKVPDSTNPAFLAVLVLSACAALVFAMAAGKPRRDSLTIRNLRDAAVGMVLILFIFYGLTGFRVEQAVKQQNTDLRTSIARLQAQAAASQAEYTRMTGIQLPPGAMQYTVDMGRKSLERQIATIHKTAWFDLGFVLSFASLCAAVAIRLMRTDAIVPAGQSAPLSIPPVENSSLSAAGAGRTSTNAAGTWDAIKARARRFVEAAKAKATEAVEAGKVEVELHHERAAVAACERQLDQLALECGSAAIDASAFADATLNPLQQQAIAARQKLNESQSKRDGAATELAQIDAKANPAKAGELTAWIKAMDATVRRQIQDVDKASKDLGGAVLAASLDQPALAPFYQRQQEIRQRMDQHTASIARLQQQQVIHKAALGMDVKRLALIAGGTLVLAVTTVACIIAES